MKKTDPEYVCVLGWGRGGVERGLDSSPKFKYPSELSTQYSVTVNCHEIDTR